MTRDQLITAPLRTYDACRTFHGIDCQVRGCAGNPSGCFGYEEMVLVCRNPDMAQVLERLQAHMPDWLWHERSNENGEYLAAGIDGVRMKIRIDIVDGDLRFMTTLRGDRDLGYYREKLRTVLAQF